MTGESRPIKIKREIWIYYYILDVDEIQGFLLLKPGSRLHTEIAWSVTAFNSTDIRSVHDNVAIPVTAMMVIVCISTDALSSVFISPDLSDTNSFHDSISAVGPSCLLQPVLTDCNSLFPTYRFVCIYSGLFVYFLGSYSSFHSAYQDEINMFTCESKHI